MAERLTIQVTDRQVRISNGDRSAPSAEMCTLPGPAAALTPAELAEVVLDAMKVTAAGLVRTTLVLPSSWCYVHRLSVPRRRPSRTTLAYALEEYLPVEVEHLTCDFLRCANGAVIGVAIETERLRELLATLSDSSVHVERITVDVIYGAQYRRAASSLLWCDAEHVALLTLDDGRVTDLRVVRLAPDLDAGQWCERIYGHLDSEDTPVEPTRLLIAGCADDDRLNALSARLNTTPADEVDSTPTRPSVAQGFDLARDALAPANRAVDRLRAWRRVAAASLLALLALCVGLAVHQSQLRQQLHAITDWERACFRELFPGQSVPAGVALRVASERRRLEGLILSDSPTASARHDALGVLHSIVAALPDDLRLDLRELRFEGRDVTIRGAARDHRQAERLTQTIDALEFLQCAAPRTDRQREGGVQFFAHARFVEDVDPDRRAKP